jgi:hypothetical protein
MDTKIDHEHVGPMVAARYVSGWRSATFIARTIRGGFLAVLDERGVSAEQRMRVEQALDQVDPLLKWAILTRQVDEGRGAVEFDTEDFRLVVAVRHREPTDDSKVGHLSLPPIGAVLQALPSDVVPTLNLVLPEPLPDPGLSSIVKQVNATGALRIRILDLPTAGGSGGADDACPGLPPASLPVEEGRAGTPPHEEAGGEETTYARPRPESEIDTSREEE